MTDARAHWEAFNKKLAISILKNHHSIVKKFTDELYEKVRENVSMQMHTEHQYAKMDYPFARRHGSIKPHGHTPIWSVHMKDGRILKGLKKTVKRVGKYTIGTVGWFNPDDITDWVVGVLGTEKMEERPVLYLTATQINLPERFNASVLGAGIKGMG